MNREAFAIGGETVAPGTRRTVHIPVSTLSDHTPVNLSAHVVHGAAPGPVMFVSAAIHGDEVIGVEIVRRLLRAPNLDGMAGTLLAVPVVNAFGFLNHARYLPDRRDLNRCFPGSPRGSLAARLADRFLTDIVARAQYGIDLHSAAIHRTNLPQVRVSPARPDTMRLAEAFGAPVVVRSKLRDGSLRQAARERGVDVLLYEAGEGLRFDEFSARVGVAGILRVMAALGMVDADGVEAPASRPILSQGSAWVRSPAGGLLRAFVATGDAVEADAVLGIVSDPFGEVEEEVRARHAGVVIGRTNLPVVNEGDGLFHIAEVRRSDDPAETLEALSAQLEDDPLFDEDEII